MHENVPERLFLPSFFIFRASSQCPAAEELHVRSISSANPWQACCSGSSSSLQGSAGLPTGTCCLGSAGSLAAGAWLARRVPRCSVLPLPQDPAPWLLPIAAAGLRLAWCCRSCPPGPSGNTSLSLPSRMMPRNALRSDSR